MASQNHPVEIPHSLLLLLKLVLFSQLDQLLEKLLLGLQVFGLGEFQDFVDLLHLILGVEKIVKILAPFGQQKIQHPNFVFEIRYFLGLFRASL